ncbi:DUF3073 family protein [Ornithinimicrobium sp. LYQ103]|uniref:DUF3073 family protein n=1 Tax=Ornithinimicrobium sp. LYQ103 TaxID=3378796 RepID=UPI003852A646
MARKLKYSAPSTDLTALERELHGAPRTEVDLDLTQLDDDEDDDDPYAAYAVDEDDDEWTADDRD